MLRRYIAGMKAEMEYFSKEDMPCAKLREATELADRLARQLEKKNLDTQSVTAICFQCGIKVKRLILTDGALSYLPGRGWPEKCSEFKPRRLRLRR